MLPQANCLDEAMVEKCLVDLGLALSVADNLSNLAF